MSAASGAAVAQLFLAELCRPSASLHWLTANQPPVANAAYAFQRAAASRLNPLGGLQQLTQSPEAQKSERKRSSCVSGSTP